MIAFLSRNPSYLLTITINIESIIGTHMQLLSLNRFRIKSQFQTFFLETMIQNACFQLPISVNMGLN